MWISQKNYSGSFNHFTLYRRVPNFDEVNNFRSFKTKYNKTTNQKDFRNDENLLFERVRYFYLNRLHPEHFVPKMKIKMLQNERIWTSRILAKVNVFLQQNLVMRKTTI